MDDCNIRLTQANFNDFIVSLNHRMTSIETDVKWMRIIGYYLCGIITTIAIKLMIFS